MMEVWQPRLLDASEKGACRELWEEIFTEDSKRFLDYYDRWKYKENECYGIFHGDRLASMLQLNPYEMQVRSGRSFRTVSSCYIIAVATREEYRHRGMMAALLKESLGQMRNKGIPFTFLMPAAEAIYAPFGFRYFYESNEGMRKLWGMEEGKNQTALSVRPAGTADIPELVAFSEEVQSELFDCYTSRNPHYYEMLFAELASEGGGMLLLTEPGTEAAAGPRRKPSVNGGRLVAAVPYWGEDPVEIREVLCRLKDKEQVLSALDRWWKESRAGKPSERISVAGAAFELEKKKPVIMGRIVDAVSFLGLFSSERPMELFLELSDKLLEENSGVYRWSLSPEESRAERITFSESGTLRAAEASPGTSGRKTVRITSAELFSNLMGGEEPEGALEGVRACKKSYINEIV